MKTGIFVSGTDTGVGKTVVSSLVVASLYSQSSWEGGYFKPVQTGLDSDRNTVAQLMGMSAPSWPEPVYSFPEPIAPHRAAALHRTEIQIDQILVKRDSLGPGPWVVEGAGGLLVPLNQRQTMRDLACALEYPLIIVASTRLGTINHCLLTLEASKRASLPVLALVLTGDEDPGLEDALREVLPEFGFSTLPLIRVPRFETLSSQAIREAGPRYFPYSLFKKFL